MFEEIENGFTQDNLKVVFILYVGTDSEGMNIYHFMLSEDDSETFAEGWAEKPSCNENISSLMIDSSMYQYIKELKTTLILDLAQDNCCYSMQDCRDHIVALAYENLDNAEEYPEPCRIVIHFGDYINDVEKMFAQRDLSLKYIERECESDTDV